MYDEYHNTLEIAASMIVVNSWSMETAVNEVKRELRSKQIQWSENSLKNDLKLKIITLKSRIIQ